MNKKIKKIFRIVFPLRRLRLLQFSSKVSAESFYDNHSRITRIRIFDDGKSLAFMKYGHITSSYKDSEDTYDKCYNYKEALSYINTLANKKEIKKEARHLIRNAYYTAP